VLAGLSWAPDEIFGLKSMLHKASILQKASSEQDKLKSSQAFPQKLKKTKFIKTNKNNYKISLLDEKLTAVSVTNKLPFHFDKKHLQKKNKNILV